MSCWGTTTTTIEGFEDKRQCRQVIRLLRKYGRKQYGKNIFRNPLGFEIKRLDDKRLEVISFDNQRSFGKMAEKAALKFRNLHVIFNHSNGEGGFYFYGEFANGEYLKEKEIDKDMEDKDYEVLKELGDGLEFVRIKPLDKRRDPVDDNDEDIPF